MLIFWEFFFCVKWLKWNIKNLHVVFLKCKTKLFKQKEKEKINLTQSSIQYLVLCVGWEAQIN